MPSLVTVPKRGTESSAPGFETRPGGLHVDGSITCLDCTSLECQTGLHHANDTVLCDAANEMT